MKRDRTTKPEPVPEYFTLKQLSERYACGLGERFIRDALKHSDHPLPHFRLNNKTILVSRTDFDAWLERYRRDQGSRVDQIVDEILS